MNKIPVESRAQTQERYSILLANTKQRITNEIVVAAYQLVKQDWAGLLDTAESITRLAKDAKYQKAVLEDSK